MKKNEDRKMMVFKVAQYVPKEYNVLDDGVKLIRCNEDGHVSIETNNTLGVKQIGNAITIQSEFDIAFAIRELKRLNGVVTMDFNRRSRLIRSDWEQNGEVSSLEKRIKELEEIIKDLVSLKKK